MNECDSDLACQMEGQPDAACVGFSFTLQSLTQPPPAFLPVGHDLLAAQEFCAIPKVAGRPYFPQYEVALPMPNNVCLPEYLALQ